MLISLNELPAGLQEHVSTLRECVRSALRDFVTHHKALRVRYTKRTEASIIHDYMVWYAKEYFPWVLKQNLFLVQVGTDYRIKLKRLDKRWRVSRIPTQLVLKFEHQRPLRLFDDLDLTHLYLGYQFDPLEVAKSKIWIVCPDGTSGFRFIAELPADADDNQLQVAVPAPTEKRRIKPKSTTDRATERAASNE